MAKKGTRLLLWVTAVGLLIVAAVVVAAVLLTGDDLGSDDDPERWMYIKLAGLSDSPATPGLFDDPADLAPLTTEMTQLIRDAAADEDIPGLLVEVAGPGVGWAQAQELRDALATFNAAGKPCIAWAEGWDNKAYYIGSACTEVQAHPTGVMLVNGLSMTRTYYAGTLEKIDARPNFEHVGNFKSAVEVYERTEPSEFASQANDVLLDSLFAQLVAGIAQSRGMSEPEVVAMIDDPPLATRAALERGILDRLAFRDQVKDQVELYGGKEPPADSLEPGQRPAPVSADAEDDADGDDEDEEARHELRHYRDYLKARRKVWSEKQDLQVAVLYAEGAIVNGESGDDMFGSRSIGDRTVIRQLRELREDEAIDAVVLRVNSPGGSGSASDAIWRELILTKAEKPVVISMADYAASGGYYISMAADHIVAQPGTLTGSIGVFGGKMNIGGTMAKLGLSQHTWERGQQATLLSGTHDFNDSQRELFKSFLDVFYETFVTKAADGRSMSFQELHAVAQGRVWTGEQALEHGLIDELGGLQTAITKAVALASADEPPDAYRIKRYPVRKTFFEQLMEELEGGGDRGVGTQLALGPEEAAALLLLDTAPEVARALSGTLTLQRILANGDVAAMLPGELEIR